MTDTKHNSTTGNADSLPLSERFADIMDHYNNKTEGEDLWERNPIMIPMMMFAVLQNGDQWGITYSLETHQITVEAYQGRTKQMMQCDIIHYFTQLLNGKNWNRSTWGNGISSQPLDICQNIIQSKLYYMMKDHPQYGEVFHHACHQYKNDEECAFTWPDEGQPEFGPQSFQVDGPRKRQREKTLELKVAHTEAIPDNTPDGPTMNKFTFRLSAIERDGGKVQELREALAIKNSQDDPLDSLPPSATTHQDAAMQEFKGRDLPESSENDLPDRDGDELPMSAPVTLQEVLPNPDEHRPNIDNSDDESGNAVTDRVTLGRKIEQFEDIAAKIMGDDGHDTDAESLRFQYLNQFFDRYLADQITLKENIEDMPPKVIERGSNTTPANEETLAFMTINQNAKSRPNDKVSQFLEQEFSGIKEDEPCTRTLHTHQKEYVRELFQLYHHGASSRFAVLQAKVGGGKTSMCVALCLLLMNQEIMEDMNKRNLCVIFCPGGIINQWKKEILLMCKDACIHTPDTNDPWVGQEFNMIYRDALEGKNTFMLIQWHVLGHTDGKDGRDPFQELGSFIQSQKLRCHIICDEAHLYVRNPHEKVASNLQHLCMQYDATQIVNTPTLTLCTGTLILKSTEAKAILTGVFDVKNLPVQALEVTDVACKVLDSMTVPSAYTNSQHMPEAGKHGNAQYVFLVQPSPNLKNSGLPGVAHQARCGTKEDPFEYQPSLFALMTAYLLWKMGENVLIFWENVEGIKKTMEYMQQIDCMRDCFFAAYGEMNQKDRERVMERFKEKGGIFLCTPQLFQTGTNFFVYMGIRYLLCIGQHCFRVADKQQQVARLDRFGQKHPAVLSIYFQSTDELSEAVQGIVSTHERKNSAATNMTVQWSSWLDAGNQVGVKKRKRVHTEDHEAPQPKRVPPKVLTLEELGPLVVGLLELANGGVVFNPKNWGFRVDPESKILPHVCQTNTKKDDYCRLIRSLIFGKLKRTERSVEQQQGEVHGRARPSLEESDEEQEGSEEEPDSQQFPESEGEWEGTTGESMNIWQDQAESSARHCPVIADEDLTGIYNMDMMVVGYFERELPTDSQGEPVEDTRQTRVWNAFIAQRNTSNDTMESQMDSEVLPETDETKAKSHVPSQIHLDADEEMQDESGGNTASSLDLNALLEESNALTGSN